MKPELSIAIIAASSALAGVIISQAISLLLSYLDRKHKKNILLRQKFEEMMFLFQNSLNYHSEVGNCKTLDDLVKQTHSVSAQKALGIAMLYFPTIEMVLENYVKSQVGYYQFICSVYNPDIPASAGAIARVNHPDKIREVEEQLLQTKNEVMVMLKLWADEYTKA